MPPLRLVHLVVLPILSLVLLLLVGRAPAEAQQGWTGRIDLLGRIDARNSGFQSGPDLVGDRVGNVTVWWTEFSRSAPRHIVVERYSAATGRWSYGLGSGATVDPVAVVDVFGDVAIALIDWDSRCVAIRYDATTDTWSRQALSEPGQAYTSPQVAIDASGNVVVVWTRASGGVSAARFDYGAASWSAPVLVTDAGSSRSLAMDPEGNATLLSALEGATGSILKANQYTAASNTWSSAVDVSASGQPIQRPALAADPSGNVTALWRRFDGAYWVVQAARFVGGTWGSPVDLSQPGRDAEGHTLDVDDGGTVFAVWTWRDQALVSPPVVQATRHDARTSPEWEAATTLSDPRDGATDPALAVDPAGNATVAWVRAGAVQTVRYTAADAAWRAPSDLSTAGVAYPPIRALADESGNVFVVWKRDAGADAGRYVQAARYSIATGRWQLALDLLKGGGPPAVAISGGNSAWLVSCCVLSQPPWYFSLQATQWLATPGAPMITGVTPGTGTLAVHVQPPEAPDPAFATLNYAYSVNAGTTWTVRDPPSTSSPIVIQGLTDGMTYFTRVRALNRAGPGVDSAWVAAVPGPGPGPPVGLTATAIAGNTVTLAWTPSPGETPTAYLVTGGLDPGQDLASLPTGSAAPTFTFAAPTGAFYVRVRALAGDPVRTSAPSNEIRIFVNQAAAPSAPAGLLGSSDGSTLTLSWTNTFAGGTPTSLWLQVGGSIFTTLPLPMGETFSYAGVPPGIYTLSVAAANATGTSALSNRVTLAFPGPCSGVPQAPVNLQAWRVGRVIFLLWAPPAGGPAVIDYRVLVDGAYTGSFTTTARTMSGAAAPGTYVIRVAASNTCGTGPPTPPQTVVVP